MVLLIDEDDSGNRWGLACGSGDARSIHASTDVELRHFVETAHEPSRVTNGVALTAPCIDFENDVIGLVSGGNIGPRRQRLLVSHDSIVSESMHKGGIFVHRQPAAQRIFHSHGRQTQRIIERYSVLQSSSSALAAAMLIPSYGCRHNGAICDGHTPP